MRARRPRSLYFEMSESPHPIDPNEPKRWLDEPANVKKVIRWFFYSCVFWAVLDAVFWFNTVDKHAHFSFEKFPFFFCIYGLVACVLLVLAAKGLRKILMRDKDYYDR